MGSSTKEPAEKESSKENSDDTDDSAAPTSCRERCLHLIFHIVMMASSMYLSMMVTNWEDINATNVTTVSGSSTVSFASETGMWVKYASVWATFLLYIWTLIAPLCCANRDFE